MADTRTRDQTRTQAAPMRESGMPSGQAPAVRHGSPPPRETAVQRAQREREEAKVAFLQQVAARQPEIERFLITFDIPWERFLGAVEIGLNQAMKNDEDFCMKANPAAFTRECLRAAHIGLFPDGKQAAIVRYDRDCALLPMVEGYIEIIWKTGLVADINHNVVCEGDVFDFEEGDQGYVRHKRSLTRPADAKAIGAWCVINLLTREDARIVEIVDQVDLEKIAKASRATKGPRASWEREMHRKAPFRRAVKRMPKTERLSALIEIDDRNVILEKAVEPGDEAPSRKALFSNKPIKRKKREPLALPEPDQTMVMDPPPATEERSEDPPQPEDDGPTSDQLKESLTPKGFVLRAVITTKNGEQAYADGPLMAELWFGDLQQKLKHLEGDQLRAFWGKNRGYIEEAGRNGHAEYAMKLVALANELGLIEKPSRD